MYPLTEPVATGIEIVLVDLDNGDENVKAFSLALNVDQSVLDKNPETEAVAF
jgi:hypothetical protein